MSEPFLAEIRIFACNFAPKNWALCNGQLLSISQNTALFSLLGTYYGGDGRVTFGLPNFQGALPVNQGRLSGTTSDYFLGQAAGAPYVTLLTTEMPAHSHSFNCNTSGGTVVTSAGNQLSKAFKGNFQASQQIKMYSTAAPQKTMGPFEIAVAGGSQPHNNMMPYLGLNFCIALAGIFPPRG
jgi:microcystin-dependent protein